jgi:hypothetical protein
MELITTTNPTPLVVGLKPNSQNARPAINGLSRGTALTFAVYGTLK